MKGHVPTPASVVDAMVEKLFSSRTPKASDKVLDPGCGDGPFIDGILRFCKQNSLSPPQIVGVELNPVHAEAARARFKGNPGVSILHQDFLLNEPAKFHFVIGNPPYVRIEGLSETERGTYRKRFQTAVGRFDLYILFFEQSLRALSPGGRLVFITPEKFEYVETARTLRSLLTQYSILELHQVSEETFPGLVTYPVISTVEGNRPLGAQITRARFRDGTQRSVRLPRNGDSWNSTLAGFSAITAEATLSDACVRISCGVATGTDEVFVHPESEVPADLKRFAKRTISGRQLALPQYAAADRVVRTKDVMLIPYDENGRLLPREKLGPLGSFLEKSHRINELQKRVHVAKWGREWYRFHDSVPLPGMLRPKILTKDITATPRFWADTEGDIVPRHSVYYAVPRPEVDMKRLLDYLNSSEAIEWIKAHAQRAANGFFRIQSAILKRLPIPSSLVSRTRGEVLISTERQTVQATLQ